MTRENMKQVLGIIVFIAVYFWLSNPGTADVPPDFSLTQEGIKALDSKISVVKISGSGSQIDIDIIEDPIIGGGQDWNWIANKIYSVSKKLLSKQEVKTVTFIWWSSGESAVDWARVIMERDKLPSNWLELTYLQFFSSLKKLPGTVESGRWLCEFYGKHESARPNGILPDFCKN